MDSTPETVVTVENGNSAEKELNNDEIKGALPPKKDNGCEVDSPAIESEQNDCLEINLIENTEKEVEGISSITDNLTDTIDKETAIQSDSSEISETDTKMTDPTTEKRPLTTNNSLSKVDSALEIEAPSGLQDRSTLVDVEDQAANVEDSNSEDDGEESFSEDEDPKEPTIILSELTAENYKKNEIVTPNESLKEKEKKLNENKGEEELTIDHKKSENGSIGSGVSIKKPNDINLSILDQDKKLDEHIPVQSEFPDIKTNESGSVKLSDQKDFNNQIKDIISDIDINIKAQEKITELKEQELKLIQKQNELANQIHQQQLLAQQLNEQNQFKQQQNQWEAQQLAEFESRRYQQSNRKSQPMNTQSQETTNVSKTHVDLRKIFTPATDTPEILPKNRKLYASSAFYSPTLHPTVEDQVELARRISHSLSDISNQTSKGQSMYVNRKKRSVKWVHEGSCQGNNSTNNIVISSSKANSDTNSPSLYEVTTKLEKMPLKLVMNPKGQVRDYNSLKDLINIETGLLSPDNCAELITALQLHQGRGAELFAKRRKKADNWIVDETNAGTQSLPSGIPDYQQYQPRPKAISPNILPAYSDAGKHRVQLNLHQNQLIEKYSKGGVQVVKSPWEAALQTGSASSAFLEESQGQCPTVSSPSLYQRQSTPRDLTDSVVRPSYDLEMTNNQQQQREKPCINSTASTCSNPQRVLAYKPNVAQGWGGRSVELPKEYFESNEGNELPCQNCDPCCTKCDTKNMDFVYTDGEQLSANFTIGVENRLNQLEHFQRFLMEQQHRLEKERVCKLSKQYIEINDKINVRELIQSFEQQAIMETSKNFSNDEEANYIIEGLYIPKEISLSSYVPPPQKQPPSQNYESTFRPMIKSNFGSSVDIQSSNGRFPLSNSNPSGYSTVLPKQHQSLSLQPNYQKESINNIAPQVNFNPSPLSFDKLSRYENQPDNQNQQQYLNIRQKTQVHNASPIPFGTSKCTLLNESIPRSPICSINSMGTSPQPHHPSSVPYHRSLNQDQSFNKLARGWGDIQSKQNQQTYLSQYIPPVTLSRNVPYTEVPYSDF